MDSLETLDKLGKDLATNQIFVLKINAEGHDYKVLVGATQLLQEKRVECDIFETGDTAMVRSVVEFMAPSDTNATWACCGELFRVMTCKWSTL
jgi:hypothetical protein